MDSEWRDPKKVVFPSRKLLQQKLNQKEALHTSQPILPPLDQKIPEQLYQLLNSQMWDSFATDLSPKETIQSFYNPTLVVELDAPQTLEHISYAGNIWIRSNYPVVIGATAQLKDIVISAPSIRFEKGFKGRL